jgi:hypothetical protein
MANVCHLEKLAKIKNFFALEKRSECKNDESQKVVVATENI